MKKITSAVATVLLAGVLSAAPATDKKETKAKDPVCGMMVDSKTAEKSTYKGKTYYFCSREDRQTFEKTPDKYVKAEKNEKKM